MEGRLVNAQTELKSELRNAQLAQEGRLEKAQMEFRKELGKNIDSNNYKLLFRGLCSPLWQYLNLLGVLLNILGDQALELLILNYLFYYSSFSI